MDHPHGASKPQAPTVVQVPRKQRTPQFTYLRSPSSNILITVSKAQLVKRLQNASKPTQRPSAEGRKLAGHGQKSTSK